MKIYHRLLLYLNTIKYLKSSQIVYRFINRLPRRYKTSYRGALPGIRNGVKLLSSAIKHPKCIFDNNIFNFLNHAVESDPAKLWNNNELPKLWLYNLHYFNDLKCVDSGDSQELFQALILSWIDQNPPGNGVGWEPYPLSIRIVNLVKWQLAHQVTGEKIISSLVTQIRYLESNIEYHLKGNHLFSNAKALVFAGCFFDGPEAFKWFKKGMKILLPQVREQILEDGGHFERSPMYHALALEDMLDLKNLIISNPEIFDYYKNDVDNFPKIIEKMIFWLNVMTHPDGNISFFNDAAFGIAVPTSDLNVYAEKLGHKISRVPAGLIYLEESGYVRVTKGGITLLIDVAPVGPDYIPAHAHADSLSYELSFQKQRVIVNSGTSHYYPGSARDFQRGTSAHSTVEIDSMNSTEVWHSFRVARRARVYDVSFKEDNTRIIISAKHDGYLRLKKQCIHQRTWIVDAASLEIIDDIQGKFSSAVSRHYLHPKIQSYNRMISDKKIILKNFIIESSTHDLSEVGTYWYPEFGLSIPNKCIAMSMKLDNSSPKFQLKFLKSKTF